MQTPTGLHRASFEPVLETDAASAQSKKSGMGAYAQTLRVRAWQEPALAADARVQLVRMAEALEASEGVLATFSTSVNLRAYTLMERLTPAERRGELLCMVRSKERRAACVCEVYDRMLVVRQDVKPYNTDFYMRLNDAVVFCDSQDEIRTCIQAHRIASMIPELEHYFMKDCGRCCFRVQI
jgi:hypothetical protein